MTEAVKIRRATPKDREAIAGLWRELMDLHRDLDPKGFALADDALTVWFDILDKRMTDEDCLLLVAEAEKAVVGFMKGSIAEDSPVLAHRRHGYVGETCVAEEWRRRGVGRRLYQRLVEWFRERGMKEIRLHISAFNPVSDSFWRALGFSPYLVHMRCPLDVPGGDDK